MESHRVGPNHHTSNANPFPPPSGTRSDGPFRYIHDYGSHSDFEDQTASCGRKRSTRSRSSSQHRRRYKVSPSNCSSHSSAFPRRMGYRPISLSVVSNVASLTFEVKTLSKCVSKQSDTISEMTDAFNKNFGSPTGCCRCKCHASGKRKAEGRDTKSKKRQKTKPEALADHRDDPTYHPPIDTNFSVEHIPPRATRGKKMAEPHDVVDLTRDIRTVHEVVNPKVNNTVVSTPSACRNYNNLAPAGDDGRINMTELANIKVSRIPTRMHLCFIPGRDMDISGIELAVATYIFGSDLSKSEVLVEDAFLRGDRATLQSLKPRGQVVDDQAAIEHRPLSHGNLLGFKDVHMGGYMDKVMRIYVPMLYPGHWYLMIIDVPDKKHIYLDSYRRDDDIEKRKIEMTEVAPSLESITLGRGWLSGPTAERPRFSSFDFAFPVVPQQHRDSMDCGVWVSQWMIRENLWGHYNVEAVGPETWMRLATDLVLRSHNPIARDVVDRALRNWRAKESSTYPTRRAL
ncbi:hypothetical protein PIB30_000429 [Stylosanthes scabra]|uniref:Ubiquitin-like protease family profile domain-containing protein n=1 Tax=Stylosanthes scabra TaxID=79078 RepID=A0ABU6V5J7_9FABA|nr:hypothetical protein [Stylosanthes scabra]